MTSRGRQERPLWSALAPLKIPIVVAAWLLCYWAPWLPRGSGNVWLGVAAWSSAHGLGNLDWSTKVVTAAVTLLAILGALLRVASVAGKKRSVVSGQTGLFLTGASLSVLLPLEGAGLYILVVAAVALAGWLYIEHPQLTEHAQLPLWQRLLAEAFPILAAMCFLTISWQYNAELLMRGLLVSAGIALLVQAALPSGKVSAG